MDALDAADSIDAMGSWVSVTCPHCFETLEVLIDAETRGELVQDCEVCCNPWRVVVRRRRDGEPEVSVEAL